MKKELALLLILGSAILCGCTIKEKKVNNEVSTNKLNITTENGKGKNNSLKKYIIKHKLGTDGPGEDIDISLDGKIVFSKKFEDGGMFYKLIDNIIFIDYGTGPEGRNMELIDLDKNGKKVFETERYNGEIKIEGDIIYFNYSDKSPLTGIDCPNKEQIEKEFMGSIAYEKKRSYNFKTNELKNIGKIYCTGGQ